MDLHLTGARHAELMRWKVEEVGNALRRPLFSRRGSLRRLTVLGEASLAGIVDG